MAVDVPIVRKQSEDAITSGTLRLTLGTQAAAVIGALLVGLDPFFGDSFSSGQKTAIVIAAVAFVALAQVADVLARAWTTAAASVRSVPLPRPINVTVKNPEFVRGQAVEMLVQGGDPRYLVVPEPGAADGASPSWHPTSDLHFP